ADDAAVAMPDSALGHRRQLAPGAAADDQHTGSGSDPGLEGHADKCDDDAVVMFDSKTGDLGGVTAIIAVTYQPFCDICPDAMQLGCHEKPSPRFCDRPSISTW